MNIFYVKRFCVLLVSLLPAFAFSHSETSGNGFVSGFTHPILGFDHLLAMLSVGILSAQYGRRFILWVPSLFVFFMFIGGLLGLNGVVLPYVEFGIALSVLVLGLGIMLANNKVFLPWLVPATVSFVVIFGSLHGYAHGVEMPVSVSPVFYSFGFIVSTGIIHLVGVLVGHFFSSHIMLTKFSSVLGALFAGAGCLILSSTLN